MWPCPPGFLATQFYLAIVFDLAIVSLSWYQVPKVVGLHGYSVTVKFQPLYSVVNIWDTTVP